MTNLQVQTNPLERIGLNQRTVRRFCAENGLGLQDLDKLTKLAARHSSASFHPDVNKTPQAEQVFNEIQQAASEIETEDKLRAQVEQLMQKPGEQVERIREQHNSKLVLVQKKGESIANAFKILITTLSFGSEMFEPTLPKIQRFCLIEPDFLTLLQNDFLDFSGVYVNGELNRYCEYFIDSNGKILKYELKSFTQDINPRALIKYKPKPDELILDTFEDKGSDSYKHLYRVSSGKYLSDTRIIGVLFHDEEDKINIALNKFFELAYDTSVDDTHVDPGEKPYKLSITPRRGIKSITPIIQEFLEGFTLERFVPLINYFSFDFNFGFLLLACKMTETGPRIIPLGKMSHLHEKTPGLYRNK